MIQTPISSYIQNSEDLVYGITNDLLLILILMVFLAYLVINELINKSIQEKVYEHAMLRTLGWNQSHVVFITIIKGVMFFVIPGVIVGLVSLFYINEEIKDQIKHKLRIEIHLDISFYVYLMGLVFAVLLALTSMAQPIYNNLQAELRDNLNVFRNKAATIQVFFSKLSDKWGLSINQFYLGMVFTTEGFLTYVFIPMAMMTGNKWLSNFLQLSIFSNNVIGMVLLIQMALRPLARVLIIIHGYFQKYVVRNKKPHQYQAIILKNLDAHKISNQRIGIMFITTVMFLMFVKSFSE